MRHDQEFITGSSVDIEHSGNTYKTHAETPFHLIIRKAGEQEQYIYTPHAGTVRPGKNTEWVNKYTQAPEFIQIGKKATHQLLAD